MWEWAKSRLLDLVYGSHLSIFLSIPMKLNRVQSIKWCLIFSLRYLKVMMIFKNYLSIRVVISVVLINEVPIVASDIT